MENYLNGDKPMGFRKKINVKNLIAKECLIHSQAGRIFFTADNCPAGVEPYEVQFQKEKDFGFTLGENQSPISLSFLTQLDQGSCGVQRFTQPINGQFGFKGVTPYMMVPVIFSGSEEVYRLNIKGLMGRAIDQMFRDFERTVVKPFLKDNPKFEVVFYDSANGIPALRLYIFDFDLAFGKAITAGESWIRQPYLVSANLNEVFIKEESRREDLENIYQSTALPFLEAQELAREKEDEVYHQQKASEPEMPTAQPRPRIGVR